MPAPRSSPRSDAALLVPLLLLAILPYANTLANSFVYDDIPQLVENPYVRSFSHLREIFGTTAWSFQGAQGVTNYYRPLMTFSYLVCFQLFGPLPYGFHLANVLLHAAIVLLLFVVTRRLFANRGVALVAAALFALHPIHTESVAWVAGVPDLQLTLFYLLTFWFFLGVAQPGGGSALTAQLAMTASFILAMLSKESALTLPLLATLYEHLYRNDRVHTSLGVKLSRYGSLWLLASGYLVFRARFLGGLAPVLQRPGLSWPDAVLTGFTLVAQYVEKLLWPARLCMFYVFHKAGGPRDPRVVVGLAVLVLSGALFVFLWRRARPVSFALLWVLVTLAPVLNARWMAANVFAERYLYLPSVGFCWLVACAAERTWSSELPRTRVWRPAIGIALGVIATLYAVRTVTRNSDWHDELTLYTRTLEFSPDAYLIRANLGTVYWNMGRTAEAEREWREALREGPSTLVTLNNLGILKTQQKRYPEAVEYLKKAIALKPTYAKAHQNLGAAYEQMGLAEQAETEYQEAVRLAPLNAEAHSLLGKFFFQAGRLPEAEEEFRRGVEISASAEAYERLGDIYLRWGQNDRAEQAFARAVALDPFAGHAHIRLGALYAAGGRRAQAAREYEAGLETEPANAEALAALQQLKAENPPQH